MINEPVQIVEDDFQHAWLNAVRRLMSARWELRNLVVHIKNPTVMDQAFHQRVEAFARSQPILGPKHVAYTIFPHGLYRAHDAAALFTDYNRRRGFFDRVKTHWGTYFRRMTHYEGRDGPINQLGNIITAIRDRKNVSKAAYTVVIQKPGGETVRPLGGPCLNYLAVQAERRASSGRTVTLALLAVYRNHEFMERAYGNYWGLCNLAQFIANECCGVPGPLTCLSSRAYVSAKRKALKAFVEGL
jgi:hypothetical protein